MLHDRPCYNVPLSSFKNNHSVPIVPACIIDAFLGFLEREILCQLPSIPVMEPFFKLILLYFIV
jgi:hypothetical protein